MAGPKMSAAKDETPRPTDFEAWGKRLRRAYRKASRKEAASKDPISQRKRAPNAFKLAAYQYYRDLKQARLLGALQDHVQARDKGRWKGRDEGDAIWLLRLASTDDQTDSGRKTRSRWAAELRLADLNDVQPELLLGFLYEAGPGELIERDAKGEVRFKWAECYRAKAAVRQPSKPPKIKRAPERKGRWD